MTAEFFAQSSEAANVDLWPVRSSSSALPGGARGAFTMVLSVRAERRRMIEASSWRVWRCGALWHPDGPTLRSRSASLHRGGFLAAMRSHTVLHYALFSQWHKNDVQHNRASIM